MQDFSDTVEQYFRIVEISTKDHEARELTYKMMLRFILGSIDKTTDTKLKDGVLTLVENTTIEFTKIIRK